MYTTEPHLGVACFEPLQYVYIFQIKELSMFVELKNKIHNRNHYK